MKDGKRDYKKELQWEHKTHPNRVKDRAGRNKARDLMGKKVGKEKIQGKDIGHVKAMSKGGTTTLANLAIQSMAANRSFSRNSDGSMKSETSKRELKSIKRY
jgi:Holliday junction resolvasome RuvABC ATP-dependent DNA helicase subunit